MHRLSSPRVADSVSPQGDCCLGTASGAPQWCPERARIIHHREARAQKLRDAVSNLPACRDCADPSAPRRRIQSARPTPHCGHVDGESRKGKVFQCTQCDRTDDADVNAARVMQQRARRWLELRKSADSDREANEALWEELRAARRESGRWGADREATAKPAGAAKSTRTHNGATGATSTAPAGANLSRNRPGKGRTDGDGTRGHEPCPRMSIRRLREADRMSGRAFRPTCYAANAVASIIIVPRAAA